MEKMKKFSSLFTIVFVSLILVACSLSSQKTFVKGPNQVTLQYEDKKISTITVFMQKRFEDWGVENKEEAEEMVADMSGAWGQVDGASRIETSVSETDASFKVILDTTFLDADEMVYAGILGGIQDFTNPEQVEKQLKDAGYQEK